MGPTTKSEGSNSGGDVVAVAPTTRHPLESTGDELQEATAAASSDKILAKPATAQLAAETHQKLSTSGETVQDKTESKSLTAGAVMQITPECGDAHPASQQGKLCSSEPKLLDGQR